MRMIPPGPHDGSTGSERKTFSLLSQISFGPDAYALSSLNLAEHDYQRWGEIDFFLAMPAGLLAMEIKGGDVDCINGVWRFEDRNGRVVKKNISPIAQAQAGYSSLLNKYLQPSLPKILAKTNGGFCALFPGASRISVAHLIGGTEMPPELIGTKEDCINANALAKFIGGVMDYWVRHQRKPVAKLSKDELRSIVQVLRPSVDRVQPLCLSLKRVRDEQLSLTSDQYRLLDYLAASPRLVCMGGAGTGKTFIAVECLRREISMNPVLITGTTMLAAHLRASNVNFPERIFSFDELAARSNEFRGAFSTLIVDEGQQITSQATIDLFEAVLGEPFASARWRWFSDPNYQVSSTSNFNQEVHASLLGWANAVPNLPENCRNTPKIIEAVEFLTGSRIGSTKVKGMGPDVEYAVSNTVSALIQETAIRIRRWVDDDGIPPGEIVLLSMLPISQSIIPAISHAAKLDYAEWKPGWTEQSTYPRQLGASNIEQFRGIEAPVGILCDLAGTFEELERAFYLGMTRANFGLFIACTIDATREFTTSRLSKTLAIQVSSDRKET